MPQKRSPSKFFKILLVGLILLGVALRFAWNNWSQDTNLHPDEYGLTNTLTQLSLPQDVGEYFNTRISPLSPYQKYDLDGQPTVNGPDNRMRWGQWPIILIRAIGQAAGETGYGEIRLLGRSLSALADTLTLLLIFLTGERLYNYKVGLLAAALSSLAVMQIQQSHFMTVDNFAGCFAALAMYAAAQIATRPCAVREPGQPYRPAGWGWFILFGVALGMTVASRINLAPLAGMVLIAVFISVADLPLKSPRDLPRIALIAVGLMALAAFVSLLTFRVTQPMTFRAPTGDTSFFTLHLNQDWLDSMEVAATESRGVGGGPPSEQWAHRPAILFPLANMLLWGMGLPLGIAGWAGFFGAAWQCLRLKGAWRAHLLPLIWVGGYFLFMATRWVKSIRYFLPIYPFLCLLAAWGLYALWQRKNSQNRAILAGAVVIIGTLAWTLSFVNAVYLTDHTRIQAARWIFQNVPAPFHLSLTTENGAAFQQPVGAPDNLRIAGPVPFVQPFSPAATGALDSLLIPHIRTFDPDGSSSLRVVVALDAEGTQIIDEALVTVQNDGSHPRGGAATASFTNAALLQDDQMYFLIASSADEEMVAISRNVIANEHWDEGLPMPLDGYDPYGMFYRGIPLEIRWYDAANKLEMLLNVLNEADYIIMPSQRSVWSSCRIPLTYPMTMEYYRALFDGRLGFDLAAHFSAPMRLGPLAISDVGGTWAWNSTPALPLFNNSLLAAEEAFSVYDHPPVWIFAKRADFDLSAAEAVLSAIDLSQVVIETPFDATGPPCR